MCLCLALLAHMAQVQLTSHFKLLHQDIVVDYASALAHKALAGAAGKGGRMLPEDLLYLLRKVHIQGFVSGCT